MTDKFEIRSVWSSKTKIASHFGWLFCLVAERWNWGVPFEHFNSFQKNRIFASMRVYTFLIDFLIALLPDYAPAVSCYDVMDVCLKEVVDTEEDAIERTSSHSLKRIPQPSRQVSSGYRAQRNESPQLSICKNIERQWLMSCSLRL